MGNLSDEMKEIQYFGVFFFSPLYFRAFSGISILVF